MSYLTFLLKSSNAHGIHSPFVYELVTEGFYSGKKISGNGKNGLSGKVLTILFKTINHCKSFKLVVYGENSDEVTETIREVGERTKTKLWFFSPMAPVPGGLDLGFICGSNTQSIMKAFEQLHKDVTDQNLFVLTNIHKTPEIEKAWETIKKDPNVTVTIDTYHLGLIFFRKGQAKQHFIIRPYRSILLDAVLGIRNLWGLLA